MFWKKEVLKNYKNILVPSIHLLNKHKPLINGFLDLRFPRHPKNFTQNKETYIVIPGTVNSSRNYHFILSVIEEIATKDQLNITVEFLGKGKSSYCPRSSNFRIKENIKGVDQNSFNSSMLSADFGIIPVKPYKTYKGIMEQKGLSNISGAINDFYCWQTPALVPSFYPLEKPNLLLKHYDKTSLKNQLLDWIKFQKHRTLSQKFQDQKAELMDSISAHNYKTLFQ